MNIFVLDREPKKAAMHLCDKHVVKMTLESAQILCSAYAKNAAPYKQTHINHPCSLWARKSKQNYNWLIEHAYALCDEYEKRYGKIHKSKSVINWCDKNSHILFFNEHELTSFVQCMPEQYKDKDSAVNAYRVYYKGEKSKFAKWKFTDKPSWW
jgi:hypothetical protein